MRRSIEIIQQRITAACRRCGRDEKEVKLIAVSKTFPAETIRRAYENGLRVFGENKAQEFRDKTKELPQDIEWHFIGHLQTNKIKYVLPKAALIHSVDSLHLAQALSAAALRKEMNVNVLLEINTSDELSKFGAAAAEAAEIFEQIMLLQGLVPRGLMTMAPFTSDEKKVRRSFALLRGIREELKQRFPAENVQELSMGMSADFEWAIEEGSTMVRIGTALFGQRGRKSEANTA